MIGLLLPAFVACLVIAALHCYMGLHVIRRGVIFVDLALAQVAALGSAVGLLLAPIVLQPEPVDAPGGEAAFAIGELDFAAEFGADPFGDEHDGEHAVFRYALSLVFAFIAAGLFAVTRTRKPRVPHEAMIGIVYVVSAALAILVLNRTPHGAEELEKLLVGQILFVRWSEIGLTAALYVAIGAVHLALGRAFLRLSDDHVAAAAGGARIRLLDFVFYATFGLMVTQSVRIAGVLVVFSFLIIPGVCATILFDGFRKQLCFSMLFALIASVLGLSLSMFDMPTGPSLVAAFGIVLLASGLLRLVIRPSAAAT